MRAALLLHNIRSAHNIGSIFRTADAAGIEYVYLGGYSPLPIDRFGRVQKEIAKTALGGERSVAWSHVESLRTIVTRLKKDGWSVVGVEQDVRSIDYRTYAPTQPTLFVFGNEVRGLSKAPRDLCDAIVEIPMHGAKESLNVSVAAGIVLFQYQ